LPARGAVGVRDAVAAGALAEGDGDPDADSDGAADGSRAPSPAGRGATSVGRQATTDNATTAPNAAAEPTIRDGVSSRRRIGAF
jgi:hypothetical protein